MKIGTMIIIGAVAYGAYEALKQTGLFSSINIEQIVPESSSSYSVDFIYGPETNEITLLDSGDTISIEEAKSIGIIS